MSAQQQVTHSVRWLPDPRWKCGTHNWPVCMVWHKVIYWDLCHFLKFKFYQYKMILLQSPYFYNRISYISTRKHLHCNAFGQVSAMVVYKQTQLDLFEASMKPCFSYLQLYVGSFMSNLTRIQQTVNICIIQLTFNYILKYKNMPWLLFTWKKTLGDVINTLTITIIGWNIGWAATCWIAIEENKNIKWKLNPNEQTEAQCLAKVN